MADGFTVVVDDHGLAKNLRFLGARGLLKAERRGISLHTRMVRSTARGMADFNPGSITGRTFMKRGQPYGRVKISDYELRFYASGVASGGTQERKTRRGLNRGVEAPEPFMQRAAKATDPKLKPTLEAAIAEALRAL